MKTHGTYEHVWSEDPALDRTAPGFDFDAWTETGDESKLCIRPGEQPARFTLRHLEGRTLVRLRETVRESGVVGFEALFDGAAFGLIGITEGTSIKVPAYRSVTDRRVAVTADDVMSALYAVAEGSLVYELGARVWKEMAPDPKP